MVRMKSRHSNLIFLFFSLIGVSIFFQNCGQAGDVQLLSTELPSTQLGVEDVGDNSGTDIPNDPKAPETPLYTPPITPAPAKVYSMSVFSSKNYVCEPFSKEKTQATNGLNGLKGFLAYVTPKNSTERDFAWNLSAKAYWTNTSSLISKNTSPLFFERVSVLPIAFDQGFSVGNNEYLVNGNGAKLIEWFSVKYETSLTLAPGDKAGFYKLASISDDGVVIEAYQNGQWVEILNNDGIHAPTFKCQNQLIHLEENSNVKLRIYFYQGPKVRIANVLMFKFVGATADPNYPVSGCSYDGSGNTFTDPGSGPSQGTAEYEDLLSKGWSIIPNKNFLLPDGEVNPCSLNSLTIVNSTEPEFKIEGKKFIQGNSLIFKFLTSLDSDHIVKLYDDSGNSPILLNNSAIGSSILENGKHIHSIQLDGLDSSKKYKMEIIYRNVALNISNRSDFTIIPVSD